MTTKRGSDLARWLDSNLDSIDIADEHRDKDPHVSKTLRRHVISAEMQLKLLGATLVTNFEAPRDAQQVQIQCLEEIAKAPSHPAKSHCQRLCVEVTLPPSKPSKGKKETSPKPAKAPRKEQIKEVTSICNRALKKYTEAWVYIEKVAGAEGHKLIYEQFKKLDVFSRALLSGSLGTLLTLLMNKRGSKAADDALRSLNFSKQDLHILTGAFKDVQSNHRGVVLGMVDKVWGFIPSAPTLLALSAAVLYRHRTDARPKPVIESVGVEVPKLDISTKAGGAVGAALSDGVPSHPTSTPLTPEGWTHAIEQAYDWLNQKGILDKFFNLTKEGANKLKGLAQSKATAKLAQLQEGLARLQLRGDHFQRDSKIASVAMVVAFILALMGSVRTFIEWTRKNKPDADALHNELVATLEDLEKEVEDREDEVITA